MDYLTKRSVERHLKGLNEEIRWARREIRRSKTDISKQADLQRYRHVLSALARLCHLTLAFHNGTPYACAERVSKSAPNFPTKPDLQAWATREKLESGDGVT